MMNNKMMLAMACAGVMFMCLTGSCNVEQAGAYPANNLRATAYPLVTIDPYTSVWAFGDTLYSQHPRHWTGFEFPMLGVIKVDGVTYRFMGVEDSDLAVALPTGDLSGWDARYTLNRPAGEWYLPDYDDSGWQQGQGAFGTPDYNVSKTGWSSENIWVRRPCMIADDVAGKDLILEYSHDDNAEIYINGTKIIDTGNAYGTRKYHVLTDEECRLLVPGKNVIAAHCLNPRHGGLIDFGLFTKEKPENRFENTARQKSVTLLPTRTIYEFECGPVSLDLRFTAPMFLDDAELVSRPVNYISYDVQSTDGKSHEVEIYVEVSPNWAVNIPGQSTLTETMERDGLHYIKTGTTAQNMLATSGDNIRIDWGHFYLGAPSGDTRCAVGNADDLRFRFSEGDFGNIIAKGANSRAGMVHLLGSGKHLSGNMMVGYDDICSVQFMGENLRPYWNRRGDSGIHEQFGKARDEYASLMKRCAAFDSRMMAEAEQAGGREYAELCAAAYRQSIAGHKLVEAPDGDMLFFSKENSSNGSIGTVDISYPSMPLYLCYNPEFVKGMMNPIFKYSESGKWTKPFSPHDVGIYPLANGEAYQDAVGMPIEECGNMLIMAAAIARTEGNAGYAARHWDTLSRWAAYLVDNGFDPSNQLCTDDFAGHMAHNANLSVKAILGIASYGYLAGMLGDSDTEKKHMEMARGLARQWMEASDDGDHYRLAFDREGTWSQKYNLVWDKLLGFDVFPPEVVEKELAYYKKVQNRYGLPLDSRSDYTKTDWVFWTATLADDIDTFRSFIVPLHNFMNESPDRVPMSDWVFTSTPNYSIFKARPVVGAYFIRMLEKKMKKA